jgi:hypothetical protein
MSDILQIIPLKNNLFTDYREAEVKKQIVQRIHELGMMTEKYKLDSEFLTFLVNIIEYLVQKKDKIDKKQLALAIMREQFNATPDDIDLLSRNIDYLANNKVIKKVSFYKLFKVSIKEWLTKK